MRAFYLAYSEIVQTPSAELANLYTLLAPGTRKEILHLPPVERVKDRLSEHHIRAVLREPLWSEQRRLWREIAGEGSPT